MDATSRAAHGSAEVLAVLFIVYLLVARVRESWQKALSFFKDSLL